MGFTIVGPIFFAYICSMKGKEVIIVSILADIFDMVDNQPNDKELGKALRSYKHDLNKVIF